jgi:hypothetical protein
MIRSIAGWLSGWTAGWRLRRMRPSKLSPEQLAEIKAANARRARALADTGMSPVDQLIFWWGEARAPDVPDGELDALETRYSIRFPDDFRAYLKAAMPSGNDWDPEGTKWWPLSEIKSVREECDDWEATSALDSDRLLIFADFLIWSYAWAIDCSGGENRGKVAVISGNDRYVADNFDDFVKCYLRGDPSIH